MIGETLQELFRRLLTALSHPGSAHGCGLATGIDTMEPFSASLTEEEREELERILLAAQFHF